MSKKILVLDNITEECLLNSRISDLSLKIEGTWINDCVNQLHEELENKGISFKPKCYLADEWLTPDKEPVVGIPFYLADPELTKLEKKMMLEVEGGTKEWCMKLLRHETGHAINYAYKLYVRRKWQNVFGLISSEYNDFYYFRPYSKSYVRHLENHYAQCHPDEDFAETFAVWLGPYSNWKDKYSGWKAIKKLHYVDSVMSEIGSKLPAITKGKKHWHVPELRIKLKNYYKKKRDLWAEEFPDFHDAYLLKIFSNEPSDAKRPVLASTFLTKNHKGLLNIISSTTGERKFIINNLIKVIKARCRFHKLYLMEDKNAASSRITAYITTLAMKYAYTGRFKG